MKPYDVETIFLALTLRYGETSAVHTLNADKFIFDSDGEFGTEYKEIWTGICSVALDRQPPTLTNVTDAIGYTYILRSLVDRLTTFYHIYEFDAGLYSRYANLINKQGTVYHLSKSGLDVAKNITDGEIFNQTCDSIEDIDRWSTEVLESFRHVTSGRNNSYMHISEVGAEVRNKWDKILKGEYNPLLDAGMPTLQKALLFPRGNMAVVHGLSGSGKSSFVFQVLLGTALGLVRYDLPGCVAVNSLEMGRIALVEKIASFLSRVNVSKLIACTITPEEIERFTYWLGVAERLPFYIDDTNFLTTTALQYRATGLHVSKDGPVVQLATDYGELFDNKEASEELRVASVFREQFQLSKMIDASIIAISQSTHNKAETGKTYIAGPDGTRYSRGVLQSADILLELWNAPAIKAAGRDVVVPEKLAELYTDAHPWLFVQKYRNAENGLAIPLGWLKETTTFLDLGIDQEPDNETVFTHIRDAQDDIIVKLGLVEAW